MAVKGESRSSLPSENLSIRIVTFRHDRLGCWSLVGVPGLSTEGSSKPVQRYSGLNNKPKVLISEEGAGANTSHQRQNEWDRHTKQSKRAQHSGCPPRGQSCIHFVGKQLFQERVSVHFASKVQFLSLAYRESSTKYTTNKGSAWCYHEPTQRKPYLRMTGLAARAEQRRISTYR